MRKAGAAALAMFSVFLLVTVANAEKASELTCKCESETNEWGYDIHYFPLDGSGSRAYSCGSTGCHISVVSGWCSASHAGCTGALDDAVEDDIQQNTDARVRPEVMRLASRSDVVYNASRGALQMIGCNGQWVAHVPVTPEEGDLVMQVQIALAL